MHSFNSLNMTILYLACSSVRCGEDGKTECYVNPVNMDIAVCCAPDDLCNATDYQSTDVAICMDDGGVQKYDNKWYDPSANQLFE